MNKLRTLISDWPNKLAAILTGLFLYQFVLWFAMEDSLWLPLTVTMVKTAIWAAVAVELIPGLKRWTRWMLQLLILLVYNAAVVKYDFIPVKIKSWEAAARWWKENPGQLHPYCWFVFGTWLTFVALSWWGRKRWRIVTMMAAAVLAISIRDSFSLLVLWKQAAIVIFCGLSLVMLRHLENLREKSPTGWAHIAEYPATAALPAVLILGVTMVLAAIMPDVGPTVRDPYTLWKNMQGVEVVTPGKVTGGVSGLISGASTSGYGRSDASLGGGFDFDYSSVMEVTTDHKSYWRGETRSVYTGSGWEETDADKTSGLSGVGQAQELPGDSRFNTSKLKTIDVHQTITFSKDNPSYPVLFGAYPVGQVASLSVDNKGKYEKLTWSSRTGELRWDPKAAKEYPTTYTIVSKMPVLDEAALRAAPSVQPDSQQLAEYLQLPSSLPARVRQLAQDITAGASDPYDKAKLIEKYLQETFPYNNKPDLSKGKSKDFVDRFLFEIKEGYCDYYSTAMAVLTRAVGIPSRWVKGYSSGNLPADDLMENGIQSQNGIPADPNGGGTYTVANANAHSWVEVYFEGYGWIPFEPTAGFAMPTVQEEQEVQQPEPTTVEPVLPTVVQKDGFDWKKPLIYTVSAVLLLAAASGLIVWLLRKRKWTLRIPWKKQEPRPDTLNHKLVAEYGRLVKRYRRRGYPAFDYETARETLQRWTVRDVWLAKDFEALLALFERAKYSGKPIDQHDYIRGVAIIKKLREEM